MVSVKYFKRVRCFMNCIMNRGFFMFIGDNWLIVEIVFLIFMVFGDFIGIFLKSLFIFYVVWKVVFVNYIIEILNL